jgi:hypothetical protein
MYHFAPSHLIAALLTLGFHFTICLLPPSPRLKLISQLVHRLLFLSIFHIRLPLDITVECKIASAP